MDDGSSWSIVVMGVIVSKSSCDVIIRNGSYICDIIICIRIMKFEIF